MKMILSKPISSPARTDKISTPLMMRFLRSNAGSRSRSRSRGRSRSSPMFIIRPKKNAAAVMNDTIQQEPSSPKVTCIGQVRARRASKAASKSAKTRRNNTSSSTKQSPRVHVSCLPCPSRCSSSNSPSCCWCSSPKGRVHFCCHFNPKIPKPRSSSSSCRAFIWKWVLFFRFGYCKKVDDARDDSIAVLESIHSGQNHVTSSSITGAVDFEGNEITVRETKNDFLESSCPPKNALLLTRCRSAPHGSSSLAGRFWGAETETAKNEFQEPPAEGESSEKPISASPNSGDAAAESRNSSSRDEGLLDSSSNERAKEEIIIHHQDLRVG